MPPFWHDEAHSRWEFCNGQAASPPLPALPALPNHGELAKHVGVEQAIKGGWDERRPDSELIKSTAAMQGTNSEKEIISKLTEQNKELQRKIDHSNSLLEQFTQTKNKKGGKRWWSHVCKVTGMHSLSLWPNQIRSNW